MLKQAFNNKPLFIPFIMAGHPSLEISHQAIITLVEQGCDIIEIGVPFSDPLADGPINQRAAEVALQNGITLEHVLEMVQTLRSRGVQVPIVLFSYLNPIYAMGVAYFAEHAKAVGVNGVLIVDLPVEEGETIFNTFKKVGLEIVLLASPTTDPNRYPLYEQFEPAFIYYISRCGVTGVQMDLAVGLKDQIAQLRTHLPNQNIAVGFGISTAEQVKTVAQFADGVVVGSYFVRMLDEGNGLTLTLSLWERGPEKHNVYRTDLVPSPIGRGLG